MVTAAPPEPEAAAGVRKAPGPAAVVRQITHSAATSPGRLALIAVGLVALTVLAGLVGALTLQEKRTSLNDLIEHREPLAAAAQQLYRSLSDADATAASAFLAGGVEPPALRERYEIDIAQAGAAMAKASSDVAGSPDAEAQIQQIAQQLPVYTALVETARANNRQGFPAGAAYLREASGLMRATLLPAAQELYTIDFDRLAVEQQQARAFPWLATVLAILLLAALVATQMYLTRRTNRLINIGLLVATTAVVLGLGWGTVALLLESNRVADGHENGSLQVETLVHARIVTLKCRADETLTLVARGDGPEYEEEFRKLSPSVAGDTESNLLVRARNHASDQAMAAEVLAALDNTRAWLAAHEQVRRLDDSGQYEDAVRMAIGDGPDSSATSFAKLDKNLDTALVAGRQEFLNQTLGARAALTWLVPGVVVLGLIAVAGIIVGIGERLREYR